VIITPTTRKVIERMPVPHEPGEWVSIQRLAPDEMPPLQAGIRDIHAHMVEVCASNLVGWSYEIPLDQLVKRADGSERPARKCLDEPTVLWLYTECQKLNGHADYEATQGNATAPSTTS
jgi:hypothetical protein